MRRILSALAVVSLCSASCSNAPTEPTDPNPAKTAAYFSGSMSPGESQFYSFTVSRTDTTEVTLISLLPDKATSPALSTPMSIGLGTPVGTGCQLSAAVVTPPGLTPQLAMPTTPTIFCAQIADTGQLSGPVAFTVKILYP